MQYKDYYAALGLKPTATEAEIKSAYRKLAREHHPDLSKKTGAEEKFKELSEAYEVLKDPEKRAAYDALGRPQPGQDFRPPPGWDEGFEFSFRQGQREEGFSDFFESIFGQRARPRGRAQGVHRGRDHHAKLGITLAEAIRGGKRQVGIKSPRVTADGRVELAQRTLDVTIPKGVKPGEMLRLAGQGGDGGDLFLEVEIQPGGPWRLEGQDIYLDLPVAPWEAALGAKVKVPLPEGAIELSVPAGSSSGRKLRLKGRGLAGGDFYAVLSIMLPKTMGPEAERLWQEMQALGRGFDPRSGL
jgi:curved DNA-binding protein